MIDLTLPLLISLLIFFFALSLLKAIKIVPGRQAWIVEALGKPRSRPLMSGLHFIIPFACRVSRKISLSQRQIVVESGVKTSDDAFVSLRWVLLFSVNDDDASILNYGYKVEDPVSRLQFKVESEIRQISSGMTLNDLYTHRDEIARRVMQDQVTTAGEYGMTIHNVTLEQPTPPVEIQDAMNNKLAAVAHLEAAKAEAENTRIRLVGAATAESESKKLQGEGIANERMAIAKGFREAAELLKSGIPGLEERDVLQLMLSINQTDMVLSAARSGNTSTIFVPTDMSAMNVGSLVSAMGKKAD